jgi:CheY-like chemotaxis protein
LTVLAADGDADLRRYVAGCLGSSVCVHEAADGTAALVLARAVHPDLLISDVWMPGLDGPALCVALHADPAPAAILVLVISVEPRATPGSGDGFLTKPSSAAGLRAVAQLVFR